jgi:hypothetical protein
MSRAKAQRAAAPESGTQRVATADTEWIRERFDDQDHVLLNLLRVVNAVEHLAAEGNATISIWREMRGHKDDATEFEEIEQHARVAREALIEVTDGLFRMREDLRARLPMPAKGGAS